MKWITLLKQKTRLFNKEKEFLLAALDMMPYMLSGMKDADIVKTYMNLKFMDEEPVSRATAYRYLLKAKDVFLMLPANYRNAPSLQKIKQQFLVENSKHFEKLLALPHRKFLATKISEKRKRGVKRMGNLISMVCDAKPQTAIYLMFDNATKATKIGYSSNPKQRKGTLLSDRHSIQMIFYAYPENAVRVEKHLHNKYKSYRLDGEWFSLPIKEIDNIIYGLKPYEHSVDMKAYTQMLSLLD